MLVQQINTLLANSRIDHDVVRFQANISLSLLRDDLIHPEIPGNKLRKLKYNLLQAESAGKTGLLSFGGAFSNHIAATAAAGRLFGFKTTGIIRGNELHPLSNVILTKAQEDGMQLKFISRERYRQKNDQEYLEALQNEFPDFHIIPEGGANEAGIRGCSEIIGSSGKEFDVVAVACGTGTTMAGLLLSQPALRQVLGFSAVGGNFLTKEVQKHITGTGSGFPQWEIISSFDFGGYARVKPPLIDFICTLRDKWGIFAEPIYTGKMFYGLFHLIKNNHFPPDTKILAIHTGGLDSWHGFSQPQPSGM